MRKWIDLVERVVNLRHAKSPYPDDPGFNCRIPSMIKYWPYGLTLDHFDGIYLDERKKVTPTIVDVPHALMVSGQTRVSREGVEQYLANPTGELPEVDLWQGRYNVLDGHHRIVADIVSGKTSTKCEVRDMNPIYGWEGDLLRGQPDEDRKFEWKIELAKRP